MNSMGMPRSARLTREIRLEVPLRDGRFALAADPPRNTWSGSCGSGLATPFLRLNATVSGPVTDESGCVSLVQQLDAALRAAAAAAIHKAPVDTPVACLLTAAWERFPATTSPPLRLVAMQLQASPFVRYALRLEDPRMLFLTQQFEFSASHRLHAPRLSDEENQQLFGKCNRPSGHGHNYILDVTVRCLSHRITGPNDGAPLKELEAVVMERVIHRFDHRRLDTDCPEFVELTSTVENIARIIWQLLVEQLPDQLQLHNIRVYETAKTWADVGIAGADFDSGDG